MSIETKEYKIVAKDEKEDAIVLHLWVERFSGNPQGIQMWFKKIDGQWRLALPGGK